MMTATGSSQINFFPSARSTNKLMRQKASNQINQYDDQTDHRSTACQMNQLGSLSIDALKRRQAWRALNVLPFIPHEWTASDQFIPWIAHNLDKAQHQFDRQDAQKEHSYLFIYTHCRLKSTALRRIRRIQNQSAFSWSASQNQFGSMDQKDPRSNGNQLESTFWIRSTIFSIGVTLSIPLFADQKDPNHHWSKKCFMCCYIFNRRRPTSSILISSLTITRICFIYEESTSSHLMDRWIFVLVNGNNRWSICLSSPWVHLHELSFEL